MSLDYIHIHWGQVHIYCWGWLSKHVCSALWHEHVKTRLNNQRAGRKEQMITQMLIRVMRGVACRRRAAPFNLTSTGRWSLTSSTWWTRQVWSQTKVRGVFETQITVEAPIPIPNAGIGIGAVIKYVAILQHRHTLQTHVCEHLVKFGFVPCSSGSLKMCVTHQWVIPVFALLCSDMNILICLWWKPLLQNKVKRVKHRPCSWWVSALCWHWRLGQSTGRWPSGRISHGPRSWHTTHKII